MTKQKMIDQFQNHTKEQEQKNQENIIMHARQKPKDNTWITLL